MAGSSLVSSCKITGEGYGCSTSEDGATEVGARASKGLDMRKSSCDGSSTFNFERLRSYEDPFYDIVLGKRSYPIRRVVLPVTFGTPDNYRTEHLTFEVANFKTSYHAIIGRPMLARFMVIPNHTYLVLKMLAPNGVISIFGNVEMSYKCDTEAVQLAETLEYSANTTMMLAESKKVDQSHLTILEVDPMSMALQPDLQVKKISLGLEDPSKTALIRAGLTPK
ncbi:uncharacterized protein LOC105914183 [Setaria italica]|uniref:uncharacterized protein LOC105914183 n=1 Tax=Setaria italica TaxID=4555 RepID=UPI0006489C95|nr:uncharacterized protein LOC105914183 [Setaria italica]